MPIVGRTFVADDGRVWDLDTMVRTDPDASTHPRAEWSEVETAAVDGWLLIVNREKIRADLAAGIVALKDARTAAQTIANATFTANATYSQAQLQALANAAGNLAGKTAVALTASIQLAQVITDLVNEPS